MEELIKEISEVVNKERIRALKEFSQYTIDDHQSYALMLEEYEEALDALKEVESGLKLFWGYVKNDDVDLTKLLALKKLIKNLYDYIAEIIQFCGVVEKARDSILNRNDDNDD